jgi:hypothetical protein
MESGVAGAVHLPAGNASASSFTIWEASCGWEAVPLPRHSGNSTGSATGDGQNRSRTTSAATTQVLPKAIFFPPWAAPSSAHRASATFRPHLRKKVPSTATASGSPSLSRYFTASRATARPSSPMSHFAAAKNQHARRHWRAVPAAAAIPVTVPRPARISPHASAMNSCRAGRRANTPPAARSSRSRHSGGMGRLWPGSIGGHSGQSVVC